MLVIPNNIPSRRKSYFSCWIFTLTSESWERIKWYTCLIILSIFSMIANFYFCFSLLRLQRKLQQIPFRPKASDDKYHIKKSRPHRNYKARYIFVYHFWIVIAAVFRLFVHEQSCIMIQRKATAQNITLTSFMVRKRHMWAFEYVPYNHQVNRFMPSKSSEYNRRMSCTLFPKVFSYSFVSIISFLFIFRLLVWWIFVYHSQQ